MNVESLYTSLLNGAGQVDPLERMSGVAEKTSATNSAGSFSGMVEKAMGTLNEKQLASDQAVQGLITGDADSLHNVMIKTSEAQLSLDLALQVRNKCLEAYNEVKNMQF